MNIFLRPDFSTTAETYQIFTNKAYEKEVKKQKNADKT